MVEHNKVGLSPRCQDLLEADGAIRFDTFQCSSIISYELQAAVKFTATLHACNREQACFGSAATDTSAPGAAYSAHSLPTYGPPSSPRESESHTQRHRKEHAAVPSPDLMIGLYHTS